MSMFGATGQPASLKGTGNRLVTLPNWDQQGNQQNLFNSLFPHLGGDSWLSKLASGDQSQFAQMEAPAMRQFGALQGNMASRFSGMGTGARRSSGFQNTMNSASQTLAESLQSNRMGLQSQALRDLMGMSNELLGQRQNTYGFAQKQQKTPWWESLLSGIGSIAPLAALL